MTTDAVVLSFLFIHLGVILVATAYFTLGAALAPGLTERARRRFAQRPWLPLLLGTAVSVPWVVSSLVLLNVQSSPIKFAGAVLGCLWLLVGLIGGSAMAQHVGRSGSEAPPSWVHTVRGGLLISLTWVLPLVGWLIMLPLTLATGAGCLLLGLVPMRAQPVNAA